MELLPPQPTAISGANLATATMTSMNLKGANLTGANLTNATMTGVTHLNTMCPNGTTSAIHANTCAGQGGGL